MAYTPDLKVKPMFPYGDASQREIKADDINAGKLLWLVNNEADYVETGEVGYLDASGVFTKTAAAQKESIILVVADLATQCQTIPAGQHGWFVIEGQAIVRVSEAVSEGEWATTSTTSGQAMGHDAAAPPPRGAFGIFLTSGALGANVPCFIHQGLGWSAAGAAEHIAATKGIHGLGANVYAAGTEKAAGYRFESGLYAFPSGLNATHVVTFATAFANAPIVVLGQDYSADDGAAYHIEVQVESISTTGCTLRKTVDGTTEYSCTVYWIAFGK